MKLRLVSSLPALLDSSLYRFSVSLVSLYIGFLVTPDLYGFYSSILLPLGLFQGLFEGLLRNTSSRLASDTSIQGLMQKIVRKAAYFWFFVLSLFTLFQSIRMGIGSVELLSVAPILITPFILTKSAAIQRQFQLDNKWWLIFRARSIGSSVCLGICLLGLYATRSLFWAALFLPVSEIVIYLMLNKKIKREPNYPAIQVFKTKILEARREIGSFLIFQGFFWVQSSVDRLIVSLFASASNTGLFFFSTAISRLPSEISIGTMNTLLRNGLHEKQEEDQKNRLTIASARKLLLLNSLIFLLVSGLAVYLIPKLNTHLSKTSLLILILSCSAFFRGTSSTLWTRSIFERGAEGTRVTQLSSILFTAIGGLVCCFDLFAGVTFMAFREIATSIWVLWNWRYFGSTRLFIETALVTSAAILITLFAMAYLR